MRQCTPDEVRSTQSVKRTLRPRPRAHDENTVTLAVWRIAVMALAKLLYVEPG